MAKPSVTVDHGLAADLVAAGTGALLVTAAAVVGARLLGEGVPLHVDAPPFTAQWLPHTGLGTVPAVLIALLVVIRGPQLAARLPWRPLLALSAVISLAWTMSLALIDGVATWCGRSVDRRRRVPERRAEGSRHRRDAVDLR